MHIRLIIVWERFQLIDLISRLGMKSSVCGNERVGNLSESGRSNKRSSEAV